MEILQVMEEMCRSSPRGLLLASVSLLVAVHLWLWIQRWRNADGPPGPFPWPVIGNAVQMGSAPHFYFSRMAEKYGEVLQIKLGSRTVVVLNGDAIKTALVKKGADFAGRPDFTSFQFVSNGKSMAFGNYSDWWKAHRKIAQTTVRTFSTGNVQTKKVFESHVLCEGRELLHLFMKMTNENKYFQPHKYLTVSTANIMSAVCFGKRYSYNDAEFQALVGRNDQFTKTVGAGSIVDVMPWLQYFPNPIKTIFENFKVLNREFYEFISQKVAEHRKTVQSRTVRDMTDAFILALDHGLTNSAGVFLDKEYVPPTVGDIFGASQDTLSTALQWIILILVSRHPEATSRGGGQGGGQQPAAQHRGPAPAALRHGLRVRGHAVHQLRPLDHPSLHHYRHLHPGLPYPQGHRGLHQPVVRQPQPRQVGTTGGLQPQQVPGRKRGPGQRPDQQRAHLLAGEEALHRGGPVQDAALPLHHPAHPPVPVHGQPGPAAQLGFPVRPDLETRRLHHRSSAQKLYGPAGHLHATACQCRGQRGSRSVIRTELITHTQIRTLMYARTHTRTQTNYKTKMKVKGKIILSLKYNYVPSGFTLLIRV
ncbi:cytochrome P450 1B1 isoform X1 [Conger conger]|uniref:cytochrome P450 1B1 isoform X1 n=1 Tax=Conger conger TaxID=82655 RepID=UPI002A5AD7FE|nr:cytochrome P450 1B1 isoform X1 [Conger conger]